MSRSGCRWRSRSRRRLRPVSRSPRTAGQSQRRWQTKASFSGALSRSARRTHTTCREISASADFSKAAIGRCRLLVYATSRATGRSRNATRRQHPGCGDPGDAGLAMRWMRHRRPRSTNRLQNGFSLYQARFRRKYARFEETSHRKTRACPLEWRDRRLKKRIGRLDFDEPTWSRNAVKG